MPRKHPQGVYWIGTIPEGNPRFPITTLPDGVSWIRGQLEEGDTGYVHWQICLAFATRQRLTACTRIFGEGCHFELSRSPAVRDYVWKDDSSLGQRFEFGAVPVTTAQKTDWESIWGSAVSGDLLAIPAGVRFRNYSTIRSIGSDFRQPLPTVREVFVLWGPTGTGKSRRAWTEAGDQAYSKCPRTKFWDGYGSEKNVVIDEFRGGIDVSHLLRWFDRYPVRVEVKGSTRPLYASKIWITTNIEPRGWYPDLDEQTYLALERRFTLVEELN